MSNLHELAEQVVWRLGYEEDLRLRAAIESALLRVQAEATARIEELEASLAERESTWRTRRELQWKRENPMGSVAITTRPVAVMDAEDAALDSRLD